MVSRSRSSIGSRPERGRGPRDQRLVVQPPVARPGERDELLDAGQVAADAVDALQIVRVRAHHLRAAVRDEIAEVVGDQAEIERHQHRANLRHGVEGLQMGVRIRADVGDPVPFRDTDRLKPRRPPIAAVPELRVGPAQIPVHDGRALPIEEAGPAEEVQRREGHFHCRRDDSGSAVDCQSAIAIGNWQSAIRESSIYNRQSPMRTYRYLHYDVFTDTPFEGNQLAVFPEPEGLSTEEMQTITREMNFSECTFIFPPETPGTNVRMRIFTPGRRTADGGAPDDREHVRAGQGRGDRARAGRLRLRPRRRADPRLARVEGHRRSTSRG